jgi:hypothetical protein
MNPIQSSYAGQNNVSLPTALLATQQPYDGHARFQHRLRMILMEPLTMPGIFMLE